MKKFYRIFSIKWDADKGELTPIIPLQLDNNSNWYNTIEDAEEIVKILLKENSSQRYTILPVYEHE